MKYNIELDMDEDSVELLKEQKNHLVEIQSNKDRSDGSYDYLEGIINMMDSIQDQLEDQLETQSEFDLGSIDWYLSRSKDFPKIKILKECFDSADDENLINLNHIFPSFSQSYTYGKIKGFNKCGTFLSKLILSRENFDIFKEDNPLFNSGGITGIGNPEGEIGSFNYYISGKGGAFAKNIALLAYNSTVQLANLLRKSYVEFIAASCLANSTKSPSKELIDGLRL